MLATIDSTMYRQAACVGSPAQGCLLTLCMCAKEDPSLLCCGCLDFLAAGASSSSSSEDTSMSIASALRCFQLFSAGTCTRLNLTAARGEEARELCLGPVACHVLIHFTVTVPAPARCLQRKIGYVLIIKLLTAGYGAVPCKAVLQSNNCVSSAHDSSYRH